MLRTSCWLGQLLVGTRQKGAHHWGGATGCSWELAPADGRAPSIKQQEEEQGVGGEGGTQMEEGRRDRVEGGALGQADYLDTPLSSKGR